MGQSANAAINRKDQCLSYSIGTMRVLFNDAQTLHVEPPTERQRERKRRITGARREKRRGFRDRKERNNKTRHAAQKN